MLQDGITDIYSCSFQCLLSPDCVAFDFNLNFFQCFIHQAGYLADVQTGVAAVNQFRRLDCSVCVDSFELFRDTLTYGGSRQDNLASQQVCQVACLSNVTCVAYDFDFNYFWCFFHYNIDVTSNTIAATNVNQYRRVRLELTSPHLTSPHLTSPHLTSPHLTSPHLTSSHLTSPHLTLF